MKAFGLTIVIFALIFFQTACKKSSKPCVPNSIASEVPSMAAFAAANNMSVTLDPRGLYYEVVTQGTGPAPDSASIVFVTYTAEFLNGAVFEQQTNAAATGWVLGQLIQGWLFGLPHIQKGGEIKLIVPSALGYGCQGSVKIPPNSILYFDIKLVDVQ